MQHSKVKIYLVYYAVSHQLHSLPVSVQASLTTYKAGVSLFLKRLTSIQQFGLDEPNFLHSCRMEFYHMKQFTQRERSPILGGWFFNAVRRGAKKVKTNKINKKKKTSEKKTTAIRRTKTSKWLTRGRKIPVSCCDPMSVLRNTTACVCDLHRTEGWSIQLQPE
jgi:hypothetical protein